MALALQSKPYECPETGVGVKDKYITAKTKGNNRQLCSRTVGESITQYLTRIIIPPTYTKKRINLINLLYLTNIKAPRNTTKKKSKEIKYGLFISKVAQPITNMPVIIVPKTNVKIYLFVNK